MFSDYMQYVQRQINKIEHEESHLLKKAAQKIVEHLQREGVIHLFGCGHSHLLSEEMFYRAGGLVPVNPILIEPLMLHEGAVRSSHLEREENYAKDFLHDQDIRPEDIIFVISTSGVNPVPVDVALFAKEKGVYLIAITSLNYAKRPSRHHSGKHLSVIADLAIDNFASVGDAVMTHPKVPVPFGSTSTIIGALILHAIFIEVVREMADKGLEPPVFVSGNVESAHEHNEKLIQKYGKRISLLSQK